MTGRGGGDIIIPTRPVTPPAPDSLSVPKEKLFTTIRYVGSGAAANVRSQVRAAKDIENSRGGLRRGGRQWYHVLLEHIEDFASRCHHDEETEPPNDPTWGFRVFITSYSPAARERLPRALANWAQAQELWLQDSIDQPEYRQEVLKRFKLDIVEDESLEGASDDRVREEFRAWMTGLGFTAREEEEDEMSVAFLSTVHNPSENICLVLDEARIIMLADLTFDDPKDDLDRFEGMTVRAIDGTWRRPAEVKVNETYRGVGDVSIIGLAELFKVMASPEGGGHSYFGIMHDLHPLNGMPEWTGELS
jgi:hypothetical protein